MPVSDSSSVRGIGVADSVSTSTPVRKRLDALLVLHAEPLLLVDDEQPEVLERDVVGEQPVGADDDVDVAGDDAGDHRVLLLGVRKRDSTSTRTG